jgi:hypothetical protein
MLLMQNDVGDVDGARTLIPEFLLKLEKAIFNLFFNVPGELALSTEELAIAVVFLQHVDGLVDHRQLGRRRWHTACQRQTLYVKILGSPCLKIGLCVPKT